MSRTRWFRWGLAAVVAVVLVGFPFFVDPFTDGLAAKIILNAVAVLGLNVVMGYAGQVSLGQVFFVGLGAYAAGAVILAEWGRAFGFGGIAIAFVLAVAVPGVIGLLVALAAARLKGLAIAMVTIALPLVGVPLAKRFSDLTGGAQGEAVRFSKAPEWTGLYDDQWQYLVCLVVGAAVFALVTFLVRGKYGRAFAIVKANEAVAAAMGISPYRTKVLAMTIAAMIGGVAGFLHLVVNQYTSPDTMSFGHSIELVIATIVGGAGTIVGAVIGGAYYVLLPVLTNTLSTEAGITIPIDVFEGVVIIVVLFLLPGGLTSLPRVIRRLRRRGRGHGVGTGDGAGPTAPNANHHTNHEGVATP